MAKVALHSTGGASRLAALLLPQILAVFSVVAPGQPAAAPRDLSDEDIEAIRRHARVMAHTLIEVFLTGPRDGRG